MLLSFKYVDLLSIEMQTHTPRGYVSVTAFVNHNNKIKYHFHIKHHFYITTLHKYCFFVFCLYSSYIYLCRVVMWKWCLMWKWYLILLPMPSCSSAFFGFDIYTYILFHFLKCFFIILVSILFLNNSGKFLIKYVMTILFPLQH